MGEKKKQQKKLVTLLQAIDLINEEFGNDPGASGRNVIAIGTLYNAISSKRLKAYGTRHFRQVDAEEVLLEFGPNQSA